MRFEKLIGPKGGGTYEEQCTEIRNIAEFLNYDVTSADVDYVAENLHGLRDIDKDLEQNFRKGQIGDWKTHFNSEHIEAFNERFGEHMKYWGYDL